MFPWLNRVPMCSGCLRGSRDALDFQCRLRALTPREREVLIHVLSGQRNKQIAFDLGVAEKTIKVHRGRMMHKLGMRNIVELVRIAERAGL